MAVVTLGSKYTVLTYDGENIGKITLSDFGMYPLMAGGKVYDKTAQFDKINPGEKLVFISTDEVAYSLEKGVLSKVTDLAFTKEASGNPAATDAAISVLICDDLADPAGDSSVPAVVAKRWSTFNDKAAVEAAGFTYKAAPAK